jgi:hypothetical protein
MLYLLFGFALHVFQVFLGFAYGFAQARMGFTFPHTQPLHAFCVLVATIITPSLVTDMCHDDA